MAPTRDHKHARTLSTHGPGGTPQHWQIDDLNRLTAAARHAHGNIGSIPARLWWPAFLLVLTDTALNFRELLAAFFVESYAPQRLVDSSHQTLTEYLKTVDEFSWFLSCDATFANLTEDTVERFLAWLEAGGERTNPTINKYSHNLLAIWKHAWKKHHVNDLPRDVGKLPESKRVPEAWTGATRSGSTCSQ